MAIVILRNAVAADAGADERDVLVQAETVRSALAGRGHEPRVLPVGLNLEELRTELTARRPEVVFNLVESLGGSDRLAPLVAVLLEDLGIPFTGSGADALYLAGSKRLTKGRLRAHGLPTPLAFFYNRDRCREDVRPFEPGRYLLKAEHEHASFGMDDGAVIDVKSMDDIIAAINDRAQAFGKPFLAERYIEGREFNIGLLERDDGTAEILPVAEISFDAFPPGKPRIVGYAAKWEEGSREYQETPRRFDFPASDEALLGCLRELAVSTWRALDLRGYGRVDFRVDGEGVPWILEANANPCLSPDAGFAATIERAGIAYEVGIERIISSCQ